MPDQTEVTDAPETNAAPAPTEPTPSKKVEFEDVYLKLSDRVGVNPKGELEPIVAVPVWLHSKSLGINVRYDIEAGASLPKGAPHARFIPDTRIVHVGHPDVAAALLAFGFDADGPLFTQIEPPKKADIDKAVAETRDAVESAGTHDQEN